MRNPLHRKKLQLCLNGLCTKQSEANILDTHWVQSMLIRYLMNIKMKRSLFRIEWLDDIGLPQYKEYFAESKVDGRLLNNLTLVRIVEINGSMNLFRFQLGRYHLFERHQ